MTDTQLTIIANPADLARLFTNAELFTSRDTARPTYTMVRLEVNATHLRIEATDGYTLIRDEIHVERESGAKLVTWCAGADLLRIAKVAKTTRWGRVTLTFGDGLSVETGAYTVGAPLAATVDWLHTDQVCPKDDAVPELTGGTIALGAPQLARLAKVQFTTDKPRARKWEQTGPYMRFEFFGDLKPVRIIQDSVYLLVMPVRMP